MLVEGKLAEVVASVALMGWFTKDTYMYACTNRPSLESYGG